MPNRLLRWTMVVVSVSAWAAPAVAARRLDLPVIDPSRPLALAPGEAAYDGSVLEIVLRPAAARAAFRRAYHAGRSPALDLPGLDAIARDLDLRFEPEFAGESPPAAGSATTDFTSFYIAHLPQHLPLERAIEALERTPEVAHVSPIAVLSLDAFPNDSLWTSCFWLYQASRRDLHAPEAWQLTTGDTGIVVAIADSGILPYHPDLSGVVAGLSGQLWTNWVEAAGVAGVDDDGNGFVDDVHGWDFVDVPPGTAYSLEDGSVPDNDPSDLVGHGTFVAGLAGALTDNGKGIAGLAQQVRLMPVRMAWRRSNDPPGAGGIREDFAAAAIRYATRMGATVINCSWSNSDLFGLSAAATEAVRAGVTLVVSAGNSGATPPFNYLARREDVISVAATRADDLIAGFSSRYLQVDLSAPGFAMTSTGVYESGPGYYEARQPTYFGGFNGTSFSAPLVSATVALIQARQRALGLPPLHPMAVQLRLIETTDDIDALNPGVAGLVGTGRLNTFRALSETAGSTAGAFGARTVGPAVVFEDGPGQPRLAFVTDTSELVVIDALTLERLHATPLAAPSSGQLAAADFGAGIGLAFALSTLDGSIVLVDRGGALVPGWPTAPLDIAFDGGPAIGDIDGDCVPEIVCGAGDGLVYAFRSNGQSVPGFPRGAGTGVDVAIALADLDGYPGLEIVAAAQDRVVAISGTGTLLPGWPVLMAQPTPPVVLQLEPDLAPSVIVASGRSLHALAPNGSERAGFPAALVGQTVPGLEPALGDLDLDGADEIVIATRNPPRLEVFKSSGAPLSGARWPRTLVATPDGSPVLGSLNGEAAPGALLLAGGRLLGTDREGDSLRTFPKRGGAGRLLALADLDGDGSTEVAAGSGPDSVMYVYDAGPGSHVVQARGWTAYRGNMARTGSRLDAPGLTPAATDVVPPSAIADLAVEALTATSVRLTWTAPGDDGASGRATWYDVRRSGAPIDASNVASAARVGVISRPRPPGSAEQLVVRGLREDDLHHFVIRAIDDGCQVAPLSNLVAVRTPLGAPAAVADLRVTGASDVTLGVEWTATGADGAIGMPLRYVVSAAEFALDENTIGNAPLHWVVPATTSAGGTERATLDGLDPGRQYWIAVVAEDEVANLSTISNVAVAETGVGGPLAGKTGMGFAIDRNPAHVPATFYWQSASTAIGQVQVIRIYDGGGRLRRALPLGGGAGGVTPWDGRDDDGRALPAGIYFARFSSGPYWKHVRLALLP